MLLSLSLAAANPFDGTDLDARRELLELAEHPGDLPCRTPLVAALHGHWNGMTASERARVDAVLTRPGGGLFSPVPERSEAAPPPATDSCWSWSDNRIVGDHFVVEYETGVDRNDAETFLEDLEYSWSVEVDELGWRAPNGSDDYLILAYIENERSGGAYTSIERCDGEDIPYFVTGKDSWDDPTWGATMAAHEFNHAIQFGYGYANEFWWWEATATWIEDYVYPNANYWSGYVSGYSDNPHLALGTYSDSGNGFWHMYGMAIFAFYLDDYQGGHDTVMGTWEDASRDRGSYSRTAEDMADDRGLEWATLYADFAVRNTTMAYTQQRYFPEVDIHDTVTSLPADGKSSSSDEPEGYGQNYILFEQGLGDGDLVVSFEGDDGVDWSVQLVESKSGDLDRVEAATSVDGVAELTLSATGDADVYLVVSPLTDRDSGYSYTWTAELVATPDDTGGDDTGQDSGTGDTDGDGIADGDTDGGGSIEISGGCGCDTGPSSAMATGVVLLAGLSVARRRF